MIKRTVIYNIKLCTDYIIDFSKYNKAFKLFVKEFERNIKYCYSGRCQIQITIGCFKFSYPNLIHKKLLPQLHIIASGKDAENIDKLIDFFINAYFDLATYQKFYVNKNPFSKKNNKLFSNISYQKQILKINNNTNTIENTFKCRAKRLLRKNVFK